MHRFIQYRLVGMLIAIITAIAAIAILYPRANRPLVRAGDAPWVERAQAEARRLFRDGAGHDRATFPIVMRLSDRICVELRSIAASGAGTYVACYDPRSGEKVEERAYGGY